MSLSQKLYAFTTGLDRRKQPAIKRQPIQNVNDAVASAIITANKLTVKATSRDEIKLWNSPLKPRLSPTIVKEPPTIGIPTIKAPTRSTEFLGTHPFDPIPRQGVLLRVIGGDEFIWRIHHLPTHARFSLPSR
jgi:hypothetical protein